MIKIKLLYMFLLLTLLTANGAAMATGESIKANPKDAKQVERGKMIYVKFCASCHGMKLEGQANWRKRKADGKLPAPPHDETGHTWHHPDKVLFDLTKNGLQPPNAPENYDTDMPAWKDTLTDDDIWAVLAYIKSRWPDKTQKIQGNMNKR